MILIAAVLLTGFVIAGALATVPILQDEFSGQILAYGCGGSGFCSIPSEVVTTHTFPGGSSVTLHWQTISGGPTQFWIFGPIGGGGHRCDAVGTAGACSFTAQPGGYVFNAVPTAENFTGGDTDYSGTFTAPLV